MGCTNESSAFNERNDSDYTDILTEVVEDIHYDYGGYMETNQSGVVKYILIGYDPGVNFQATHYPHTHLTIVCSNESGGAYDKIKEIENVIL